MNGDGGAVRERGRLTQMTEMGLTLSDNDVCAPLSSNGGTSRINHLISLIP